MEAADMLCDSLFRWLENRKECAGELLELAQKLEDVHQRSNTTQGALGAATSVLSFSGALLATFFTGGLAGPLLAAATVGTVAGAAVSATSTLVEALITSSTFNKATELIKEDEKVGRSIQKLLRDLKDRCGEAPLGPHADELDCEMATQLMCALARRSNTPVPLDLLRGFNRATFFRHMTPGGLPPAEAMRFICQALGAASLFSVMTSGLKESAEVMMKNIGRIGTKAAAKAGSKALGVIGLGTCMYDLIVKTEEPVKGNRVTEASEFLRDSAREILDGQQKLKEQLDAVHKIIQKLLQMKRIKNLGGYSHSMNENEQKIMDYIIGTCTDKRVLSWLEGSTNKNAFLNLLRLCLERLTIPEDLTKFGGGHINIVFVAHGSIVNRFMPAGGLVPAPYIRDTILYSPWNCAVDSKAAYAIAQGSIRVTDRQFYNKRSTYCQPDPLPDHWNSMRRSLHNIPEILLSPLTPEEIAWDHFSIGDRVIIPYVVPQNQVKAFREIPLYMFIFATSYILSINGKTATVHLAACLSRPEDSPARPEEWRTQYAYTSDDTCMTVNQRNRNMDSVLFRAFRSLLDWTRR